MVSLKTKINILQQQEITVEIEGKAISATHHSLRTAQ
jgi:hypothetical protein